MKKSINSKIPRWKISMENKKLKNSIVTCWIASIGAPLWLFVDYLSSPNHITGMIAIQIPTSLIFIVLIVAHKRLQLKADLIGLLTICVLSIGSSYSSSQMGIVDFQQLMMSHTAIFLGASMLLLIELKYSILAVLISAIANVAFYISFSTLTLNEYLINGSLLVLLVAIIMIFSIQMRYNLTSRLINSNLVLKSKQSELIKAKHLAQRSNEMQREFLSNMSHEIRTPMNGIIGITRVLQGTKLNDDQKHYISAVLQSADNLMLIINDILDFSKIEAGKIEMENVTFNLDNLLIIAQEILISEVQNKGLYLRFEKHNSVPTWLNGDPVRLNQILMNLIANAIKFTNKGGVTLKVTATSDNGNEVLIRFSIIDTGIGIPDNKKDSIFNSFSQANSNTTRLYGGTGLGLTISKQLVELQGGNIGLDSEFGKGSTFSFEIKYGKSAPQEHSNLVLELIEQKSIRTTMNDLKGKKILLVEDHPINQMLAIKVLEGWGFDVDLAENGLLALNKLKENNYTLILMDINMPVMDGYEATSAIRSGNNNKEIPIIAMTASAFIGENQKCIKVGMNDYISKPFDPQELLTKINNQINKYLKIA